MTCRINLSTDDEFFPILSETNKSHENYNTNTIIDFLNDGGYCIEFDTVYVYHIFLLTMMNILSQIYLIYDEFKHIPDFFFFVIYDEFDTLSPPPPLTGPYLTQKRRAAPSGCTATSL